MTVADLLHHDEIDRVLAELLTLLQRMTAAVEKADALLVAAERVVARVETLLPKVG